ncbi:MAG TPA: thioredoxin-disulfide reductase [Euryarchaeota archaeon]|nr:MAG: thioredoxin-disulfide reductase [Thermoplasmatales archaeon ex4484_6]RLF69477.1 MAG: thioredoxin-disulfide reductase [Thermoplasmata archaeon]HHD15332.1 thioredoxin-disulfide reductase [Euryarchaeota archaeon]
MTDREFDLLIIGGGPAGFTAGIYAGRSGLKTAILEKQMAGGQVIESPLIENWPGVKEIQGPDLVMKMREHAEQYVPIMEYSEVTSIGKDVLFVLGTPEGEYRSKAVVIATGARHRHLGVPGEDRLSGKGVSFCATCDGFFFKEKDVLVVGGGSTALLYAIYLNNLGCRVKMVHRRDEFRGEKALQDQVRKLPIELIMSSVVEEFRGEEVLSSVVLRNVKTDETTEVAVSGAFIAVGEVPQTRLAVELGVELDESGFIKVDRRMRTNVPGIYAAGDVTGGLMQIIAAAGEGAQAATSAFEELMEPYWLR